MKLRIIKGENGVGRELLEIETEETRIVVGFGEEKGTGSIPDKSNPMIEGLTTGEAKYDGIIILRNPENCNIVEYALKEIPVYMEKKIRTNYETCMDFWELPKKENIKELVETKFNKIKDLEVTPFIIDPSNLNTHIIRFRDGLGKSVVVCGDFRNYDGTYGLNNLHVAISAISHADTIVLEGKYLGKHGAEFTSSYDMVEKLRNIMKFYKQVFVIQSETDLLMTQVLYKAAVKTKKSFIENTFLCNLSTTSGGSAPTPFNAKKVYSYNPLDLENRNFEFKKKYVTPFLANSAINRMKKEKYLMNITKDMLQDIQIFQKEGSLYDACVIFSEWKGFIEKDGELEEFINILKSYEMDYYELYTCGQVNLKVIKEIIDKLKPRYVIPLDFSNENISGNEINNFKVFNINEEVELK